jgi:hypothetical protein
MVPAACIPCIPRCLLCGPSIPRPNPVFYLPVSRSPLPSLLSRRYRAHLEPSRRLGGRDRTDSRIAHVHSSGIGTGTLLSFYRGGSRECPSETRPPGPSHGKSTRPNEHATDKEGGGLCYQVAGLASVVMYICLEGHDTHCFLIRKLGLRVCTRSLMPPRALLAV